MRRVGLVLLSVLALLAGLVAVPALASADVAGPPYTAFGLARSAVSGETGGAQSYSGAEVTVQDVSPTAAVVGADPDADHVDLELRPATGATFTAGTEFDVADTADSSHGTGRLDALSRICSFSSGTVTVLEATEGTGADAGRLTAFAADLDVTCSGLHFVGYVRVNSTVGYTGVSFDQGAIRYPSAPLGGYQDRTLTMTNTGTTTLPVVQDATFGGDTPAAYSLVGNECKSRQLLPNESCTVTVRARPLVAGEADATLVIGHDGSAPWEVALSATATDVADGTYRAMTPTRVLDTRYGTGGRTGPLGSNGVLHLSLAKYLPVPASSVVLNLTVDRPTNPGYLTAYATGTPRPITSSINFNPGWTGANLVTVPLGTANQIDIYNLFGNTSVIADMVGYYATGTGPRVNGGGYHPVVVERLLDTRTWGLGKLPAGWAVSIPVRYAGDRTNIGALAVNVTAVHPTKPGYLTTWNNSVTAPKTSTLNFSATSGVVSNSAIVPAGYNFSDCPTCATIAVLNMSPGPIDLVVDISGFFDKGSLPADFRYQPLAAPQRIVDSRTPLGTGALGQGETHVITAPPSVAGYDTVALDSNLVAVTPTAPGGTYLTVWPTYDDYPRPIASIINALKGQTVANHAIAEVGYGNRFNLFNFAGTTNVVDDVDGTFELFPHTPTDQIPRRTGVTPAASSAGAAHRASHPAPGRNVSGVAPAARVG